MLRHCMERRLCTLICAMFFCIFNEIFILIKCTKHIVTVKINSQKNCAQNKALQKCDVDLFVYLVVERDKALLVALCCALGWSLMRSKSSRERYVTLHYQIYKKVSSTCAVFLTIYFCNGLLCAVFLTIYFCNGLFCAVFLTIYFDFDYIFLCI